MAKDLLLEVRKAYRLVFDYQKRILKLIDFIGHSYNMRYIGGWSKFSNSGPNNGRGNLKSLAWDWLNMYYYEFHFQIGNDDNYIAFSVFLVNDTGYYEALKKNQNVDKWEIETYFLPEDSTTKLILVAGHNHWNDEWHNWQDSKFLLESYGRATEGKMVYKSYPLEDFFDEEAALNCLRDFQKYCESENIPLSVNEPSIKEMM